MKKQILTIVTSCLAIAGLRADIVYQDSFNYSNGPIVVFGTNSPTQTNWFHTGSATATDFYVNNHKAEISASGGTLSRAEDVHCNYSTFTNSQTIMYASFIVNCTNLPPATGTYFAHFWAGGNNFHARVFAQAGSLANTWRLGVSAAATTVNKVFPFDLVANTDYQVVLEWDPVTLSAATLWANPISAGDPNVITADAVTLISPADGLGFGFRQASSFGNFFCTIS